LNKREKKRQKTFYLQKHDSTAVAALENGPQLGETFLCIPLALSPGRKQNGLLVKRDQVFVLLIDIFQDMGIKLLKTAYLRKLGGVKTSRKHSPPKIL